MPKSVIPYLLLIGVSSSPLASAETFIIDSGLASAYHFVDTYEILIDGPAETVWPHLLDVASWMVEFDMIHESGPRNAEGQIFRLYEGEDFFVEIAKIVPSRMVVLANLPSSMQDEKSVGVAMITLTELGGRSLVSSFMSRHYVWTRETPDPFRNTRQSAEFQAHNRTMWEDRFLPRLRALAEAD